MGAGNALAVMRQYGRAKGVTGGHLAVLTFMALQTLDADEQPLYFGGRRRIAAGCMGAQVDLRDAGSQISKTDANRVSECLTALVRAGAITKVREGAARMTGRRVRDFEVSAAYRLNIAEGTRRWVEEQLRSSKTRPEIPGASTPASHEDAPGNPGHVQETRARDFRARVDETRPETPGTQRSTSEEVKAEERGGGAGRAAAGSAPVRHHHPEEPYLPPKPSDVAAPSRCPKHQDVDSDEPCGRCRAARIAATAAEKEHAADIATWERQRDDWKRWLRTQPLCDEHGFPGGGITNPATGRLACPQCARQTKES